MKKIVAYCGTQGLLPTSMLRSPVDQSTRKGKGREELIYPRSDKAWLHLFASAGLTVLKDEVQLGFPAGLFMVKS